MRCFTPGAAAGLSGLVLASFLVRPAFPPKPPWWELRFLLEGRGEYAVTTGGVERNGRYTFTAAWEGVMEKDGPDFLLVRLKSEIRDWQIHETPPEPDASIMISDKSPHPSLDLYYVLGEGDVVRLDFEMAGISVPLGEGGPKCALAFPCSGERAAALGGYNESIIEGTNRIAIPRRELERSATEKRFSWKWKRRRWVSAEGGPVLLDDRHHAQAVVSLVYHDR